MTSSEHPQYARPTFIEGIAELHFELPPGVTWQPTFFGEFIKRIQFEFPKIEPVFEPGFQITIGNHGMAAPPVPLQRFRFTHADRPLVLQLSENNVFTVNVLRPYSGWQRMREDIGVAWQHVIDALAPAFVTRASLRFINQTLLETTDQRPSAWLNPNDFVPSNVLGSGPGFFSRGETRTDSGNATIVTLAYQPSADDGGIGPFGAMILDIDRIMHQSFPADKNGILERLDVLHEDVWNVFNSAKSEKLELLMKGRQP